VKISRFQDNCSVVLLSLSWFLPHHKTELLADEDKRKLSINYLHFIETQSECVRSDYMK